MPALAQGRKCALEIPQAKQIYQVPPLLRTLPWLSIALRIVSSPPVWPETPPTQSGPNLVSHTPPPRLSPHAGLPAAPQAPSSVPPQSLGACIPTAGCTLSSDFRLFSLTIQVSAYMALPRRPCLVPSEQARALFRNDKLLNFLRIWSLPLFFHWIHAS